MSRNLKLINIRPKLELAVTSEQSDSEIFQNVVLRPILKLQNKLLVSRFLLDTLTKKSGFESMDDHKKRTYVKDRLKTDKRLQAEYIGLVVGLFTVEEFETYWAYKSDLNKRILSMLSQRIYDQSMSQQNA